MVEILVFILGSFFGSFANVLILRLPKGEDFAFKSSYCFHCKENIKLYLNIPILSYLFLQGKTKCCNKKLNLQYPVVEFLVGLLFLINYLKFDLIQFTIISILFFIIVLVIFIDFNEKIIVDLFNYSILGSGLIVSYFFRDFNPLNISLTNSLFTAFIGFALFGILRLVFKKLRNVEALGLGDVILIAGLGWLGFENFYFYYFYWNNLLFNFSKNSEFQIL